MDECKVNETLDNILDAIDAICKRIAEQDRIDYAAMSGSVFALARTYDMLAQYDETAYQDGEYDES